MFVFWVCFIVFIFEFYWGISIVSKIKRVILIFKKMFFKILEFK